MDRRAQPKTETTTTTDVPNKKTSATGHRPCVVSPASQLFDFQSNYSARIPKTSLVYDTTYATLIRPTRATETATQVQEVEAVQGAARVRSCVAEVVCIRESLQTLRCEKNTANWLRVGKDAAHGTSLAAHSALPGFFSCCSAVFTWYMLHVTTKLIMATMS